MCEYVNKASKKYGLPIGTSSAVDEVDSYTLLTNVTNSRRQRTHQTSETDSVARTCSFSAAFIWLLMLTIFPFHYWRASHSRASHVCRPLAAMHVGWPHITKQLDQTPSNHEQITLVCGWIMALEARSAEAMEGGGVVELNMWGPGIQHLSTKWYPNSAL